MEMHLHKRGCPDNISPLFPSLPSQSHRADWGPGVRERVPVRGVAEAVPLQPHAVPCARFGRRGPAQGRAADGAVAGGQRTHLDRTERGRYAVLPRRSVASVPPAVPGQQDRPRRADCGPGRVRVSDAEQDAPLLDREELVGSVVGRARLLPHLPGRQHVRHQLDGLLGGARVDGRWKVVG